MSTRRGELFRQERAAIEDFLQNFLVSDEATKEATTKYVGQLQVRMAGSGDGMFLLVVGHMRGGVCVCSDVAFAALLRPASHVLSVRSLRVAVDCQPQV